jgi:hypothetical protein
MARAALCSALFLIATGCDQFLTVTNINPGVYGPFSATVDFQSATDVLTTNNGGGDVVCPVRFLLAGSVTNVTVRYQEIAGIQCCVRQNVPFTPSDGVINSANEINAVFGAPNLMKVVDELNFCNGTNPNIVGCARAGGSMIVEDFLDGGARGQFPGIVIAHEFGHIKGLGHRENQGGFIMNSSIGNDSTRLSAGECSAIQAGSTPIPLGATPAASASDGGPSAQVPIEEFARRIYIDSMPFAEAMQYDARDAEKLVAMLSDRREQAHWPMIASLIGIIGTPQNAEDLISFIEKPRRGPIGKADFKAVRSAMVALGYMVERNGSPRALDYLIEASRPQSWARKQRMSWTLPRGGGQELRNQRLSVYAVMGLGLSGHRDAMRMLSWYWSNLQSGGSLHPDSMRDVMQQAMQDNARVAKEGLARYYAADH